jgi:hypothetical protein
MVPSRGKASYLTVAETYSAGKAPAHTRAREPESPRTRFELLAAVACDELVEAADFSILGFILVQERQVGLFEFSEKLVLADFLRDLFPSGRNRCGEFPHAHFFRFPSPSPAPRRGPWPIS